MTKTHIEIDQETLDSSYLDLAAQDLIRDERVQRSLQAGHLAALEAKFNLDAIGVITVSERISRSGKVKYVILDGGHRVQVLINIGFGEWEVRCHVYHGLSLAQEAMLFRALNTRRRVSAIDMFKTGVVEKVPEIVDINKAIQRAGFKVDTGKTEGTIHAVATLQKLYASVNGTGEGDPASLIEDTLKLSHATFGYNRSAVDASMLMGMGIVVRDHAGEFDPAAMVTKLGKFEGGANGIIASAKSEAKVRGISTGRAAARVMVGIYNRGRGKGRIGEA